jgi:hypothetical protein
VTISAEPDLAVAQRLVDAIAARDFDAIEACFAPDARMRALVPARVREEEGAAAIVARMRFWWEDAEPFEVEDSELEPVADRIRLRWRVYGHDAEDGWWRQEQSGYLAVEDSRIATLNVVCSGSRPVAAPPA